MKRIIKKLQDIDKLKVILLNDSQRLLFDKIPKPTILYNSEKILLLNDNKIIKANSNRREKQSRLENIEQLCINGNLIDKRISSMLNKNAVNLNNLSNQMILFLSLNIVLR